MTYSNQHAVLLDEIAKRMTKNQFEGFLRNRAWFLKAAHRILRPVTFNDEKFRDRMLKIDEFVIKSADAIAMSVRTGIVLTVSLSLGLGISERLRARIRNRILLRLIPESGGFYYVVGLGLGFFQQRISPQKNRLVCEFVGDLDRLQKIHTYAGEVSVALNWGVALDRASNSGVEKMDSHYIGILGVMRQSAEHFSYSLITGFALPPYLPVGMVYSNYTSRLRIPFLRIPWFPPLAAVDPLRTSDSFHHPTSLHESSRR